MRITLCADNTLPVALEPLCALLNSACRVLTFQAGTFSPRIPTSLITKPKTFEQLSPALAAAARNADCIIVNTTVPYENNYFFEQQGAIVILSFSGWNILTNLPVSNGIVYFIARIVFDWTSPMGYRHQKNIGCLNDFWWDKHGVDVGMRAAFVCPTCLEKYQGDPAQLQDVQHLLDLVSGASRRDRDVLSSNVVPTGQSAYDIFLCHNSDDKPVLRDINTKLKKAGIRTWLDEEQLPLGTPWQTELERQISKIAAAAVFVGPSGLGPWQNAEIRAFLSEFLSRGCPVIPVLLPGISGVPELPMFLKQMTWLDLRSEVSTGLARLASAVRPPRNAG